MAKNIVICCDGTGNEVGANEFSNVAKLYAQLDKCSPARQASFYDPGLGTLGTPGFRTRTFTSLTRLMGLAFGYGLHDNVKDAYLFLMQQYAPGDRVFLFGFSRGAYTVRALAGMLFRVGLLNPGNENLVEHAIKRYFEGARGGPDWKGMGRFKKLFGRECPVHFIGVWDTVKSIGILRRSLVLPDTASMRGVAYGRHAVSLNEKRTKFRPNLWNQNNGDEFAQVWFAGVHSDVGGGYQTTGLSDITLTWMLTEADKFGLLVNQSATAPLAPDPLGAMENSSLPLWWLLGWRRRHVRAPDNGAPSWVHASVRERRNSDKTFDKQCRGQFTSEIRYV